MTSVSPETTAPYTRRVTGAARGASRVETTLGDSKMTVESAVRAMAGVMVLGSLALGYFVSPWFYLLTTFVGLNLFQSAFTGFCPAAAVFKKLGATGEFTGAARSAR